MDESVVFCFFLRVFVLKKKKIENFSASHDGFKTKADNFPRRP